MRKIFFTVGPTQTSPLLGDILQDGLAQDVYSISHRSREFAELFAGTSASIKQVLGVPEGFHVFFIGSATEGMELIIENCVQDSSFHFVNGAFSKRFFETASELQKHPEALRVSAGEGFDVANVPIPPNAELVCITANETSTGVQTAMADIRELKRRNPDKIFAADIVSSAPYVQIDFEAVDCMFFSVQKGFGMPAGLGVLIVNDRCIQKSEMLQKKGRNIGSFHNFPALLKSALKNQTPETPNVLGIYALGRICNFYNDYGLDRIRRETDEKAELIYGFFDNHRNYSPFVKRGEWRSKTTIVIETPDGSPDVIKRLAERGYIVGSGYGEFADRHIRIGNFPMHQMSDIKDMLKVLG